METVMAILRWVIGIGVAAWLATLVLDLIGPTVAADLTVRPVEVPQAEGLEDWLAEAEAGVPDLRPEAAKQIVWAGAPGTRSDWVVVNLHGFSASREELRPLPDLVAERLGANLFLTRLAGHGRDGAAMAEPQVADWVDDLAEAVAVGRALGDRVLLLGSSTGGTLAVLAAADPELSEALAGVVLLSPNLRVAGWGGRLIEWPGAAAWGPLLIGTERSFEPRSAGHAEHWTTRYPTRAVAVLGALTHAVRGLDMGAITVPALVAVSGRDEVIDGRAAVRAAAEWGARSELVPVTLAVGDDPSGHVLAGDILSPATTAPLVERIVGWVRGL
jgi:alpha-beta hydrolase superfamily lysophospholipase